MKAIISGASRGIGKVIAKQLAAQNYDLVLLARTEKALQELKVELIDSGVNIQLLSIDLSKKDVPKLLEQLDLSNTTLLINNLGAYSLDQPSHLDLNQLQSQLEVNLFSAIELTNTALPYLKDNQNSTIINIGSVMGLQAENMATSYSISKHAVKAWNDALRQELRPKNIKVSCIYPAAVNTSSWDGIEADRNEMIQAEDIAESVAYILKMKRNTLVEEIRISPINFKN